MLMAHHGHGGACTAMWHQVCAKKSPALAPPGVAAISTSPASRARPCLLSLQARQRIFLIDSKGLVLKQRPNLSPEKAEFAQDASALLPPSRSASAGPSLSGSGPGRAAAPAVNPVNPTTGAFKRLEDAVSAVAPTALIGAAGVGAAFTQRVLEALCEHLALPYTRPLVLALSNPTSKAECTVCTTHHGVGARTTQGAMGGRRRWHAYRCALPTSNTPRSPP